jgi:ABC-type multidrug transport system fused ATPase/permease subunit
MQDVNLFNGTFKENIIFFNDREGEDLDRELMKICQQTSLAELMEERDGLQTMVGDDGLQLSGGQKQRLGIARAIYRKAEVLIFDEATSALDSVTEEEVLETFNKLKGNATTISIAHRVQTLKNVDEIWVLNNGKIEAKGSYNQLKEQSELFKKLGGLS